MERDKDRQKERRKSERGRETEAHRECVRDYAASTDNERERERSCKDIDTGLQRKQGPRHMADWHLSHC